MAVNRVGCGAFQRKAPPTVNIKMTEKNTFLQWNDVSDHQLSSASGQSSRELCDWTLDQHWVKKPVIVSALEHTFSPYTCGILLFFAICFFSSNYLQHDVRLCDESVDLKNGCFRFSETKSTYRKAVVLLFSASDLRCAEAAFEKAWRTGSAGQHCAPTGEVPKVHVIDSEINSTLGPCSRIFTNSNSSNNAHKHGLQTTARTHQFLANQEHIGYFLTSKILNFTSKMRRIKEFIGKFKTSYCFWKLLMFQHLTFYSSISLLQSRYGANYGPGTVRGPLSTTNLRKLYSQSVIS